MSATVTLYTFTFGNSVEQSGFAVEGPAICIHEFKKIYVVYILKDQRQNRKRCSFTGGISNGFI